MGAFYASIRAAWTKHITDEAALAGLTDSAKAQLAAAVTDYVRLYPQVSIDLQMLDRTVNLVDERIDLDSHQQ